jgi:uncharacterized repeat protein (TIGR04002 family)
MKPKQDKVRLLCISGVVAAIIYIFTAFFHIPSHTGYTHIGDAFVYLAGSLLPGPYAVAAGAAGGMLADLLGGYAMWMPGTGVIKALTALCFTHKARNIINRRNLWGIVPAFVLCVGGYYLYECLITGNFIAPLGGVPGYCMQVIASAAVYTALGRLLDAVGFKNRMG